MNYTSINRAILTSSDVQNSIPRDDMFYDYLLGNSVAYYYCKYLSKEKKLMDKRVIKVGDILNRKFVKTVKLINMISKKNAIKFLLFKTYKYIPEAVDGDIDIFIPEKYFYQFLKALEKEGFVCFENEHLKAFCKKEDYCTIEPRVNASFHGLIVLNEKKIWERTEKVDMDGISVLKATREIDLFYLLLEVLYRPSYLKLYLLFLYKKADVKKLFTISTNKQLNKDFKFLIKNLISKDIDNKRFPLFLSNIQFIIWWCKRIIPNQQLTLFTRLKHILFFFYAKYAFFLFNKLVFKHNWPI